VSKDRSISSKQDRPQDDQKMDKDSPLGVEAKSASPEASAPSLAPTAVLAHPFRKIYDSLPKRYENQPYENALTMLRAHGDYLASCFPYVDGSENKIAFLKNFIDGASILSRNKDKFDEGGEFDAKGVEFNTLGAEAQINAECNCLEYTFRTLVTQAEDPNSILMEVIAKPEAQFIAEHTREDAQGTGTQDNSESKEPEAGEVGASNLFDDA